MDSRSTRNLSLVATLVRPLALSADRALFPSRKDDAYFLPANRGGCVRPGAFAINRPLVWARFLVSMCLLGQYICLQRLGIDRRQEHQVDSREARAQVARARDQHTKTSHSSVHNACARSNARFSQRRRPAPAERRTRARDARFSGLAAPAPLRGPLRRLLQERLRGGSKRAKHFAVLPPTSHSSPSHATPSYDSCYPSLTYASLSYPILFVLFHSHPLSLSLMAHLRDSCSVLWVCMGEGREDQQSNSSASSPHICTLRMFVRSAHLRAVRSL